MAVCVRIQISTDDKHTSCLIGSGSEKKDLADVIAELITDSGIPWLLTERIEST